MISTSWNDFEDEHLQGLPWGAQLLYLRGLRRRMDYRTAMVGAGKHKISWQTFHEVLHVEHHQGIEETKLSKNQLRRAMAWLVKVGLVEIRTEGRYIQFFLPLADRDETVQKKAGPRPDHVRTTKAAPSAHDATNEETTENWREAIKSRTTPDPSKIQKADLHPVSGNNLEKEEYNLSTAPSGTAVPDDQKHLSPGLSWEDGKEKVRSRQPLDPANPDPVTSPDPLPRDMPDRQAPLLAVMEVSPAPAAAPSAPPSLPATPGENAIPSPKAAKTPLPTEPVWQAYAAAFRERYQVDPPRNATVNTQMANFVKRVGAQDAPRIAAHYLGLSDRMYMQDYHSVGLMLKQAEKLKTQWAISNRTTENPAAAQVSPRSNVIAL